MIVYRLIFHIVCGIEIIKAVGGDELSKPAVIVTGYEIVMLALFVVVISAVTS